MSRVLTMPMFSTNDVWATSISPRLNREPPISFDLFCLKRHDLTSVIVFRSAKRPTPLPSPRLLCKKQLENGTGHNRNRCAIFRYTYRTKPHRMMHCSNGAFDKIWTAATDALLKTKPWIINCAEGPMTRKCRFPPIIWHPPGTKHINCTLFTISTLWRGMLLILKGQNTRSPCDPCTWFLNSLNVPIEMQEEIRPVWNIVHVFLCSNGFGWDNGKESFLLGTSGIDGSVAWVLTVKERHWLPLSIKIPLQISLFCATFLPESTKLFPGAQNDCKSEYKLYQCKVEDTRHLPWKKIGVAFLLLVNEFPCSTVREPVDDPIAHPCQEKRTGQ